MSNVSVVIPTYNGARFIREALESVFAQTLPPREIIVVDDASTDGTPELVEDAGKDSAIPLRMIQLAQNSGGPAQPMNRGVREASTEFIAILDQDDIYDLENLEKQASVLKLATTSGFVFSWCGKMGQQRTHQSDAAKQMLIEAGHGTGEALVIDGSTARQLLLLQDGLRVGFPAMMFRKAIWEATGCFRNSLRIAADYDFELAATLVSDVAVLPRIGYWRRIHDRNVCRNVHGLVHEVTLVKALFAIENKEALPDGGQWSELIQSAAWFEREAGRLGSATKLLWHALTGFPERSAALFALFKLMAWRAMRPSRPSERVCHTKSASVNGATQ
jgi:glycosyltransferase involved in cell wall biosynthesis